MTAFSKIDGFDVPPETPSSSTIRCNSPETSNSRFRLSYHTLCPYLFSSRSGFVISLAPFTCVAGSHHRFPLILRYRMNERSHDTTHSVLRLPFPSPPP